MPVLSSLTQKKKIIKRQQRRINREQDEPENKTNRQFVLIVRVIWWNESMANCIRPQNTRIELLWTMRDQLVSVVVLLLVFVLFASFSTIIHSFSSNRSIALHIFIERTLSIWSDSNAVLPWKPLEYYVYVCRIQCGFMKSNKKGHDKIRKRFIRVHNW